MEEDSIKTLEGMHQWLSNVGAVATWTQHIITEKNATIEFPKPTMPGDEWKGEPETSFKLPRIVKRSWVTITIPKGSIGPNVEALSSGSYDFYFAFKKLYRLHREMTQEITEVRQEEQKKLSEDKDYGESLTEITFS